MTLHRTYIGRSLHIFVESMSCQTLFKAFKDTCRNYVADKPNSFMKIFTKRCRSPYLTATKTVAGNFLPLGCNEVKYNLLN